MSLLKPTKSTHNVIINNLIIKDLELDEIKKGINNLIALSVEVPIEIENGNVDTMLALSLKIVNRFITEDKGASRVKTGDKCLLSIQVVNEQGRVFIKIHTPKKVFCIVGKHKIATICEVFNSL